MEEALSYFKEISVPSSLDGSPEPSLYYAAGETAKPKVLVVGLHTWSADRFNQVAKMLPFCRERGWALLLPEFRGPNTTPNPRAHQAGGSALARRDIVDAANWVIAKHFEQRPKTLLVGGSGGGHMSLLTAAREDFFWDAVSSWCPITDLEAWHRENSGYRPHVEKVCGGAPGDNPEIDSDYRERSPLNYAEALKNVRLQVAHGKHDRAVLWTHTWNLIQAIGAETEDFYFSIFDGGHEIHLPEAFAFFDTVLGKSEKAELTG